MKRSAHVNLATLGALIMFLGLATQAASAAGPPPVAVSIVEVVTQDIPVNFEYVGQIAGSKEVEIRSRISGIIEERLYDEGANVASGQMLFKIDPAQFSAQLAQSKAALASARAQTTSAKALHNKAKRELKRITPLAKKKLVSPSDIDNAASDVEIANAQVLIAEAAVQLAQANLTSASINLDYTLVRSPIKGIAGRALKTQGSLTEAGSNSLMTTVVQVDPAYANFGVAEAEHLRTRSDIGKGHLILPNTGFNVELLSSEGELLRSNGKLDFQDYKVNNATGNFAMRATIENSDHGLSPGQFVRVRLTGAKRPAAVAVPQRAVLDGPGGKYVYTVGAGEEGGNVAVKKPVIAGEWIEMDGELKNGWLIKKGLSAGDKVIVDGSARIFFPGQAVQETSTEATDQPVASN